jgi:hypothetical protein
MRIAAHVVKIAQSEFGKWYDLRLNQRQVREILNKDSAAMALCEYKPGAQGFDTFDRELLPFLLCKALGIKESWPINGDDTEYKERFFDRLRGALRLKGWKEVLPEWRPGSEQLASLFMRCYCCGQEVGNTFALVSMARAVDRVFTMLPEHVNQADAVLVEIVHRAKTAHQSKRQSPQKKQRRSRSR